MQSAEPRFRSLVLSREVVRDAEGQVLTKNEKCLLAFGNRTIDQNWQLLLWSAGNYIRLPWSLLQPLDLAIMAKTTIDNM